MVLATGDLRPEEVDRLTARAIDMGLKKIISTHPDLPAISMPVDLQKRLAERGIFFERTFNVTTPRYNTISVAGLAARIRDVGYTQTIMATDFGQPGQSAPRRRPGELRRGNARERLLGCRGPSNGQRERAHPPGHLGTV